MAEQRRLGFFGWFFRAFAAVLGTLFGLLCGAAMLGACFWIWQQQLGGELDMELATPDVETELVIETDVDLDFGDGLQDHDTLLPDADDYSEPISTESPSPPADSENKRVVTNPDRTRR